MIFRFSVSMSRCPDLLRDTPQKTLLITKLIYREVLSIYRDSETLSYYLLFLNVYLLSQLCFQTGTIGTLYPLFEPIPPILVQMTVVHEPCLKLGQLGPHLPSLFCTTLGRCTLVLGVLAMGRPSRCKPRQAVLCHRSCGSATMQGAASVALVCRPLAGRAFSGFGAAPLAGPVGTKAPRDTLLEVAVCHAEISAIFGVL